MVYTVSYTTDQQEQTRIRITSEPDIIIEVSIKHSEIQGHTFRYDIVLGKMKDKLLNVTFSENILVVKCKM